MNSLKDLSNQKSAVLIYFFNPGCSACNSLLPKVKEMVNGRFSEMALIEINASDHSSIAAEASVFSAPTLIVYFEGKEYLREGKYISINQLEEKISRYYKLLFE
jgi:thioredoxin-like negative regulator of GroEL